MRVTFTRTNGVWRWRVQAVNNRIVGTSPGSYSRRIDCISNFETLTDNAVIVDEGWCSPFGRIGDAWAVDFEILS